MNRPVFLLTCISAIALQTSCSITRDVVKRRYFDQGNEFYAKKMYREASLAFRKAVQRDSEFGEAYYKLALSELQPGGDLQRAYAALKRSVLLLPENEDAKIRLASIYLAAYASEAKPDSHSLTEAEGLAKALLARDSNSYEGLRLRGHVAAFRGNRAEAMEAFRKALQVRPKSAEVMVALAHVLAQDGKIDEAEKLSREVISLDRSRSQAYDSLYAIYFNARRVAEAEQILRAKAEALPKDPGPLLQLASHHFRQQNGPKVEETLRALLAGRKQYPQAPLLVGDFYRSIGKLNEARSVYDEGLKENGADRLEYRKRLASLLLLEGKRDEAVAAYEDVVKVLPKDQESRENRAALLLEKDVDAALREYQQLLGENPNNPMLHYNLGLAYLAKRETEKARIEFLEACRRQRSLLLPRVALAQLSMESRQWRQVQQYASEILELNPRSPEGKFYRCAALTGLGHYNDARRELNAVIKEFPQYQEPRLQLAAVELGEKRFGDAEKRLKEIYSSTRDVRALNGLVDVYFAQNLPDRALELVTGELGKNPGSQRIRLLAGQTALRAQKYETAVEHFVLLIEQEPKWDYLYLRIGEAYQLSNEMPKALYAFRKAMELSPRNLEAILRLAYAYEVARKYPEAIAHYRKALEVNPAVPVAMNNLAYLLAETGGDMEEATRLAQTAMRSMPQQKYVADTLGWISLKRNRPDAAIQVFSTLVAKYPEEAVFRYHLAAALFQKGDRGRAKSEAQAALGLKPSGEDERKIRDLLAKIG